MTSLRQIPTLTGRQLRVFESARDALPDELRWSFQLRVASMVSTNGAGSVVIGDALLANIIRNASADLGVAS